MTYLVFKNAQVLDPVQGELTMSSVLVENGYIREVNDGPIHCKDATIFDLHGKVLMPGLCDGHVHVTAATADFGLLRRWSPSYVAVRASQLLENMLMRGFTTVRDAGGADFGLADAITEGYITGPRLLYCGKALSQTGGHGDMRVKGETALDECWCCAGLGRICDGIAEVRRACRDEIRKGAHHIKIMASGGIVSPTDRITSSQFSIEELKAAVEEAEAASIYLMAHAYTARSINRALECGIRSIEHGNLMDESSAKLFLEKSAFLVPTLSTYHVSHAEGLQAGLSKETHAKIAEVLAGGMRALELAHRHGVKMVYGTDLLASMQEHQLGEFALRSEIQKPIDIIRAATVNAAELFQMQGEIGVIAVGARADLLVVDGNPLDDLAVLQKPQKYLTAIMKDGRFYKNEI